MGAAQSASQGGRAAKQERRDSVGAKAEQERQAASKQNKNHEELQEEGDEEEEEGVHVARPITATQVGEGKVRLWDPQGTGGSGALVHMGGGGRIGSAAHHRQQQVGMGDEVVTWVYVIRCAESTIAQDVVRGRCPSAVLSPLGQRQARALAMSLLSRGLRFDAVLSSPIQRCKQTALSVCQEISFNQDRLEFGDALTEMSNGLWEGLRKFDVYTGDISDIMANLNQDFHAPGGESQRQVEFRVVEFLNNIVLTRSLEINRQNDQRMYYVKHDMEVPSTQRHSTLFGWKIILINDSSHLRSI
ncbi:hypothetical protein GOP47_0022661 [Adiantum capillus-veneris]|uniref:Uncharacterized protein n=1 Tax=Adiantum capillus-veneris TaxID=13818 RepID=A0A9D4Z684_ADICA|nr:hypothetical protein GOP47_0022661 [Adiantum capillus-veneris]